MSHFLRDFEKFREAGDDAKPSYGRALSAYPGDASNKILALNDGDAITVLKRGVDWCRGMVSGKIGFVPTNHIKWIPDHEAFPSPSPKAAAASPKGPTKAAAAAAQFPKAVAKSAMSSKIISKTVTETYEEITTRRPLVFVTAVDVSGSMAGRPLREATEALKEIYDTVMLDTDKFALATFGSEVKPLHRAMTKSKVNWATDAKHIQANAGGMTALWDGVDWAITAAANEYQKQKERSKDELDVVFEVIIITDGGDNASKTTTLDSLIARLAKPGIPNFNLVVIGLGDVDEAALKKLVAAGRHCKVLRCTIETFKKTLDEAFKEMSVKLTVTTTVSTKKDGVSVVQEEQKVIDVKGPAAKQIHDQIAGKAQLAIKGPDGHTKSPQKAAAAAATPAKVEQYCRFVNGPSGCKSSPCKFSHALAGKPCRNFQKGECVHGDKCFYKHV